MAFEFSDDVDLAGLVEGVEDDSDRICQRRGCWPVYLSIAFFSELSGYVWHVAKKHRHRRHHRQHGFSEFHAVANGSVTINASHRALSREVGEQLVI